MPLGTFRAERFRCLADVELELDPGANLFVGPNASGKTSLLEAAFFLSRGRSFRSRQTRSLIALRRRLVPLDRKGSGYGQVRSRWACGEAAAGPNGMSAERRRLAARKRPNGFPRRSSTPRSTSCSRKVQGAGAVSWTGACSTWNTDSCRTGGATTRHFGNAMRRSSRMPVTPIWPLGNKSSPRAARLLAAQRDAYLGRLAASTRL